MKEVKKIAVEKSTHYLRFAAFWIGTEDSLISSMESRSEDILYYICNSKIFDIIHVVYIKIGQGDKNRINYTQKKNIYKYKNVNIKAINVYLKMCWVCHQNLIAKKINHC